jgi:four helix bundle protein
MHRYQDFTAWQLTGELNQIIFQLTSEPPACHDFKFRDNLRDAADSAQRNFPEGFGRFAPGDFAHFLDHSRASLLEVNNELAVGLDRGYFRAEDVEAATLLVKRALKALSGLQRYLRSPEAKLNAKRARAAHIARRDSNKRT